jgi:hypothetical protein
VKRVAPKDTKRRRAPHWLRRSGYVVFGVAIVVVAAIGLVLAINLPDRQLNAEANLWLAPLAEGTPSDTSYSLWALDAPANVDAALVGRSVREAYAGRAAEASTSGDWRISRPYVEEPLVLPVELGCVDASSACVSNALAHSHLVRDLAQKRAALLARVDLLDTEPRVDEAAPPAEPNAPGAQYATLVAAQSLSLALASVDVGDGHLDAGLPRLERMTRVARKLSAGCKTLACKATAVGMLRRALLVYSELMNQTPASAALGASLARVNLPLGAAERDMSKLLAFEMQLARHLDLALVHARPARSDPFSQRVALAAAPLLFKPDATFNLQSSLADLESPLVHESAFEFARDSPNVLAAFHRREDEIGHIGLTGLYNPLGRTLASGLPDIEGIANQLHDVEGLQEALVAKVLLLHGAISHSDAQAFLDTKPGGAADVYSGNPFTWDDTASSIVVPQRGSRPVGKLRVGLAS